MSEKKTEEVIDDFSQYETDYDKWKKAAQNKVVGLWNKRIGAFREGTYNEFEEIALKYMKNDEQSLLKLLAYLDALANGADVSMVVDLLLKGMSEDRAFAMALELGTLSVRRDEFLREYGSRDTSYKELMKELLGAHK